MADTGTSTTNQLSVHDKVLRQALFASVFIIASCGLVYELVAGTVSSYLLGDSVTQFSTVIGVYLFAMGAGSWASKYIHQHLVKRFIELELLVGLTGGFSAVILFLAFAQIGYNGGLAFHAILYILVFVIGLLVGLEIPLVMRILEASLTLKELVSRVLTFDYLGALAVSLAFPLFLVPHLGLMRTSLVFGLLNVAVAVWAIQLFGLQLRQRRQLLIVAALSSTALFAGLIFAEHLTRYSEEMLFEDRIVFSKSTRYQRMVLTQWRDDTRLFLNGNLQFSSRDEYRYHEALIHPALSAALHPRNVLVLGGGDGLALREILKYPSIEQVTLVDLDREMTDTFKHNLRLSQLNAHAFDSPKVKVITADAFVWLDQQSGFYDFIVVDFPDPTNFALGKLYTTSFYQLIAAHLSQHGLAVIQSTSPLYARQSFWCIVNTIASAGLHTTPYHTLVPSFGEWGYVIASHQSYQPPARIEISGLKFIQAQTLPSLFYFPPDMQAVPAEINRLNNQHLVHYYEREWNHQGP
ncbi:polyamine aminopropyltransferase [Methylophilus glucosoxydans]|uniref:Polyamine aminopropyltransferase n=1 Tax=Methylophilus glucosoxydans TaxID=752553 RepID=A0ABW3GDC6_9PROT